MELMEKQGFKQTELGLIPTEWTVHHLKDLAFFSQGIQVDLELQKKMPGLDLERFIRIENYTQLSEDFRYVPKQLGKNAIIQEDDIAIVRYGATAGFIGSGFSGVLANNLFKVTPTHRLNKSYLYRFLKSYYSFNFFQNAMSGGAMPALSFGIAGNLPIPLPPTLEEQKAIATALSDVDDLITNLDKLITKKKAIKQGAMQQLLTPPHKGGKRLSGFTGEWVEMKLGELIHSFQNGYAFSASGYQESGIPIVTMAQIGLTGQFQFNENKVNYWSENELKNLKDFVLEKEDVIISMTDVTPEKNLIGRMTIVDTNGPFFLNQRVGHLRLNLDLINPVVLIHLSNMREWRTYSKSIASLGVQANIGTTDIKNGVLTLPEIEEQNAIAKILLDMDKEIVQLETKKTKYQSLKQGMMQELLTGKTRLV